MLYRLLKIRTSIVLMTREFSTFTQFFAEGTNQLDWAALANGASEGLLACKRSRDVVLGITLPWVARFVIELVLVKVLIQSSARLLLPL
jgi:hypothetical protein